MDNASWTKPTPFKFRLKPRVQRVLDSPWFDVVASLKLGYGSNFFPSIMIHLFQELCSHGSNLPHIVLDKAPHD